VMAKDAKVKKHVALRERVDRAIQAAADAASDEVMDYVVTAQEGRTALASEVRHVVLTTFKKEMDDADEIS
jgi:hypothetical protein